jgi:hypothetical protein
VKNLKRKFFTIMILMSLALPSWTFGEEDKGGHESMEPHEKGIDRYSNDGHGEKKESHEGNEVTGQAAAWLFLAANLTIGTSLLSKGTIRLFFNNSTIRFHLETFNRWQKKTFRKWHYYLNPLALGTAILHFSLSACPGQALPEWGLAGASLIALTGLLIKIKGTPSGLKKTAFAFHTHPIVVVVLLSILLSGHLMID